MSFKFTENDFRDLPVRPNGMTPTSAQIAAVRANEIKKEKNE